MLSYNNKIGLIISFFILLTCFPNSMKATNAPEYMMKAWMIEDGLPQNSIICMQQTRNGYLWLGTQLGLVRFDGLMFPVFNQWNTASLKNNRIISLYEDNNEGLWIGTDGGGLTRLKENLWTNYQTADGLSSNRIRSIFQDSAGNIWVGTVRGLDLVKDNQINPVITSEKFFNDPINAICEDRRGNLWVGAETGLLLKKKNQPLRREFFKKILQLPVTCLWADRAGDVWVGTEEGLKLIRNEEIIPINPVKNDPTNLSVTALHIDKNGFLWIGTYGSGVYLFKDRVLGHFSSTNGLTDNFIHDITGDFENNIWIGTATGGLVRFKPRIISNIDMQHGLPENTVTAILQDHRGFFWIGTRHHGLSKFQDGKVDTAYSTANGLLSNQISALFQTKSGVLWVGTESGGLNRIGKNEILSYTMGDGLLSDSVTAVHQDNSGIVWIGTTGGLNQYINDTILTNKDLKGSGIRTFLEDRSGTLWIGSQRGLFVFKNGQARPLDILRGGATYDVLALHESGSEPGVIWAGTNGLGLIRIEKGRVTHFTRKEGLHNNYIFSINDAGRTPDHGLWISSFTGIFRVSNDSFSQFLKKKNGYITSAIFDESDGMNSSECIGGVQPSSVITRKGDIWIPTIKGVARINPTHLPARKKPIPVIIEDLIIDDESVVHRKNPIISSGKKMFEFYFTALNFSAPKNVKFRYKLEGFEEKWTTLDTGEKRTALYFNLNPGTYNFKVIACDHLGFWNEQGTNFPFRIRSDFRENLLIYIPRMLILLVFIAGFLLWRLRKKKPEKKVKKYQTSALTDDRADDILQKLLTVMEEEKIYLKPDLTLKKLSEKIMTHPNNISQIINEKMKQSYNDFINSYRIEEAKTKLLNPEEKEKSILEIAYDVGFYSKSVFNTAFKKFTGMTPSEYKQKYFQS